jgi:hypothetical protein
LFSQIQFGQVRLIVNEQHMAGAAHRCIRSNVESQQDLRRSLWDNLAAVRFVRH